MSTATANTATNAPVLRGRAGSPALVGALVTYTGVAMFVTAACGTYLSVRNASGSDFVAKEMLFNNYVAFMATVTFALASVAAGWAVTSMRISQRRWTTSGFALAAFLNVAAANLIWFLAKSLGLGANGLVYPVILYGLFIVAALTTAIGFFASLSGFLRALGGQATASQPHYGVLAAWGQHLAGASWLAIYATIYLLK
jgi:heme/copper-type cytochrome/quinol oxidase subunit 3